MALSEQVAQSEQNALCSPGTFFTHAALQSLRLYPFTNGWHPFVVTAELIYFLFLLYYMVVQHQPQEAAHLPGLEHHQFKPNGRQSSDSNFSPCSCPRTSEQICSPPTSTWVWAQGRGEAPGTLCMGARAGGASCQRALRGGEGAALGGGDSHGHNLRLFFQGKRMRKQKWGYFRSKWNLLEVAIILVSCSALAVFLKRAVLAERDLQRCRNHREEGISFSETAAANAALGYLIAFLVLLSTVKLWRLLRLNPTMNMITAALCRAWGDISGFIVVILTMLLAYSIASNLIFGWKLRSYKTLFDAAETMISLQLGIFNYEEVLDYSPVLGSFLIGSCIVFMTFVVLNLFMSVILVAFSEEQKFNQLSEEGEIVDLLLMKILSFLGIKCKREEPGSSREQPGSLSQTRRSQLAQALPKV
ncbi:polycystin-1-like protein 2 [Hylobates moloch]|uniref:polycystin-1-like protein 2 n=1 Tax=Hylobates moloch TaxID=81572 RepID=UPI0026761F33|nr:polycystin-1-like protein 2 [Hylobates moloch]